MRMVFTRRKKYGVVFEVSLKIKLLLKCAKPAAFDILYLTGRTTRGKICNIYGPVIAATVTGRPTVTNADYFSVLKKAVKHMGTKRSSLVDFREKAAQYKEFRIVFDSVFSPVSIDIRFNRVAVCNSASPYVAFVGEGTEVTLSHIYKVFFSDMVSHTYIFVCNDYSSGDTPVQIQYKVECIA